MAKRRNLAVFLVAIGAVVAATAIFLWSRTPSEADRLKFALNLDKLPESLKIRGEWTDIWTDYVTLHSVTLASSDFPKLLEGWSFQESEYFRPGIKDHKSLPPIDVAIQYEMHDDPPDGPVCRVYANEDRTEAFIEYLAD